MDSPANFYDCDVNDTKPKNSSFLFDDTVLADYGELYNNEGSVDLSSYLDTAADTTVKNDDLLNELGFLSVPNNPAVPTTPTTTEHTLPELIKVEQIESAAPGEDTEYMPQIGEYTAPATVVKKHQPEQVVVTVKSENDDSLSECMHTYSACNPTVSTPGTRNPLKAPSGKALKGKRVIDKDSDEYKQRRERNNVAVRRSREKSKLRNKQTQKKVAELQDENDKLQKKVELLTKELTVLKSLFINVGVAPPDFSGSE